MITFILRWTKKYFLKYGRRLRTADYGILISLILSALMNLAGFFSAGVLK